MGGSSGGPTPWNTSPSPSKPVGGRTLKNCRKRTEPHPHLSSLPGPEGESGECEIPGKAAAPLQSGEGGPGGLRPVRRHRGRRLRHHSLRHLRRGRAPALEVSHFLRRSSRGQHPRGFKVRCEKYGFKIGRFFEYLITTLGVWVLAFTKEACSVCIRLFGCRSQH